MSDPDAPAGYHKDNPFPATLIENRVLNKPGSAKDTRHLVVDISGSGFLYQTGDSLGVYPLNEPEKVEALLDCCGFSGEEEVTVPKVDAGVRLRDGLSANLGLAQPTKKFLQFLQDCVSDPAEKAHLVSLTTDSPPEVTRDYLLNREYLDILEEHPSASFRPQDLVDQMRRMNPRLYSIASSRLAYPDQVHLTVAPVRYRTNDRDRRGVCSTFLSDRLTVGSDRVPVFLASSHFGLTDDPERDIIMIGPGTGIAPFRAFLQEREKTGATGRNWLVFGDQHAATDYLYGEEFEGYRASGLLSRIDLAFSRDQDHKIYVQDRLRENGAELWSWIRDGAVFYVCGDAKRMAKDVDSALREVVIREGGLSDEEASAYVKQMRAEKRYQRDVY